MNLESTEPETLRINNDLSMVTSNVSCDTSRHGSRTSTIVSQRFMHPLRKLKSLNKRKHHRKCNNK